MLTKRITYVDFNGVERTEDFRFHLNKAELMEMEYGTSCGLSEMVQRVMDTKDMPTIMKIFKDLLVKSYGIKSDDGRRFEKTDEIRRAFVEGPAYEILYMELATDSKAAAEFVNGILPEDLVKQVGEMETANLTPAQIAARDAIKNSK